MAAAHAQHWDTRGSGAQCTWPRGEKRANSPRRWWRQSVESGGRDAFGLKLVLTESGCCAADADAGYDKMRAPAKIRKRCGGWRRVDLYYLVRAVVYVIGSYILREICSALLVLRAIYHLTRSRGVFIRLKWTIRARAGSNFRIETRFECKVFIFIPILLFSFSHSTRVKDQSEPRTIKQIDYSSLLSRRTKEFSAATLILREFSQCGLISWDLNTLKSQYRDRERAVKGKAATSSSFEWKLD